MRGDSGQVRSGQVTGVTFSLLFWLTLSPSWTLFSKHLLRSEQSFIVFPLTATLVDIVEKVQLEVHEPHHVPLLVLDPLPDMPRDKLRRFRVRNIAILENVT